MPQARFVRRPIYIRGKKSIVGGKNLTTGRFCRFDLNGEKKTLFIGDNCEMGDMTHIVAHEKVEIGNNVLVASKVFISDTSHGSYGDDGDAPFVPPNKRLLRSRHVFVGNNVWLGENVVILPGIKIGNGTIIGANSVVTCNVPENVIAAGVPARVIKIWTEENRMWNINRC